VIRLAWRTAALCLLLAGAGCERPLTVEQQVIATIREMEASVEEDERRRFMQRIARDFQGQRGQLNRDQVRALLVTQVNRYQRLSAQLFPISVSDGGDGTATANFRALVTGGPGWIPEHGQVYEFDTRWRRDGDDWLLVAADWVPVALEDAL